MSARSLLGRVCLLSSVAVLLQSCATGYTAFNTPEPSGGSTVSVLGDSQENASSMTATATSDDTSAVASSAPAPDPAHPSNTGQPVGTQDIYGGIVPIADTVPLGQAPASSNVHTANMPYNPQPVDPYQSTSPFYYSDEPSPPRTLPDGNMTSGDVPHVPVNPLEFAPQQDPSGTDQLYCGSQYTSPSGDLNDDHWACIKDEGAAPTFGIQDVPVYSVKATGKLEQLPKEKPVPSESGDTLLKNLFSRPDPNPLPTFVVSDVPVGWWVDFIRNQDAVQLMNYVSNDVKVLMVGQNPDYASDVSLQGNSRFSISYWKEAPKGSTQAGVEVNSALRPGIPSHHGDWVLHKMMYAGSEDVNNGFLAKNGKVHWVAEQQNVYNSVVPFSEIISSSYFLKLVEEKHYHIISTSNGITAAADAFWIYYDHTHGLSSVNKTQSSQGSGLAVAQQVMDPIKKIWGFNLPDWNLHNPYPTSGAIYLGHLVVPSDVVQDKNKNTYDQIPMLNALNYMAQHDDVNYISPTADSQNGEINLFEGLMYAYPKQWQYLRDSMIVVGAINKNPSGSPPSYANSCALSSPYCVLAYGDVSFKNAKVHIGNKDYFSDGQDVNTEPGVSFSTPYVVSMVALVRSVFPFFTNYNVQTTVLTTAQQLYHYTKRYFQDNSFQGDPNAGYPFNLNTGWGAVRPDVAVNGPKMFYFRDFVVDFNHEGTDTRLPMGRVYAFTNDISGPHGLQVIGSVTTKNVLNLAGKDSYQGQTLLAKDAIVNVDGALTASNITVEQTAALYGQGSVQSVSNNGNVHAYRYDINLRNTNDYALQQDSLAFAVQFANGDSDTLKKAAMYDCGKDEVMEENDYGDPYSNIDGQPCGAASDLSGNTQSFWKPPTFLPKKSDRYVKEGFDYQQASPSAQGDGSSSLLLSPGLLVNGDYTQTAQGTLYARLNQPLTVVGKVTLAGKLEIDGASPLLMENGREITALVLISKHEIQGTFSMVDSGNSSSIQLVQKTAYSVVLTEGKSQYYGVAVRAKYMSAQSRAARSMGSREVLMGAQNVDQIHDQLRRQWLSAPTAVARQSLMQSPLYRFAVQLQSASDDQLLKAEKALQGESYTRYLDQTEGASLQDNMLAQWFLLQHRPSPFTVESHLSATWGKGAHDYRQSLTATYAQALWRAQLGLVHDNAQLTDQPHSTKNQRWALDLGVYYQLPMFGVSVQVQAHHIKQHWTLLSLNTAQTADYAFKQNAWMESIAVDKAYRLDGGLRLDPYVGLQWVQNHLNAGDVQGKAGQLYFVLPEQNEYSAYATLGLAMNQDQVGGLPLSLGFKYAVSIPVFYNQSYAAQLQDNAGHQSPLFFETQHQTEQLLSGAIAYHVGTMSLGLETQLIYQYHWMAGLSLNASVQF